MGDTDLVIGATGTVGRQIVRLLVSRGRRIRAVSREASRRAVLSDIPASQIEWIEGDALDYNFVYDACQGIDVVYNAAGIADIGRRVNRNMWDANVRTTANIVEAACRNDVSQCHLSSVFALGHPVDGKLTVNETSLWGASEEHSAYAYSMFRREMEIMQGIEAGARAVIIEAGVIIGGEIFRRAMRIKGNARECNIPIVDAADVAMVMVQTAEHGLWNERYIAVADNLTVSELQKQYRAMSPKQSCLPWQSSGDLSAELRIGSSYSSEKLRETIGMQFAPVKTSLRLSAEASNQ